MCQLLVTLGLADIKSPWSDLEQGLALNGVKNWKVVFSVEKTILILILFYTILLPMIFIFITILEILPANFSTTSQFKLLSAEIQGYRCHQLHMFAKI